MPDSRTWIGRVFIAASLDGYIARPDGDIAWLTDPEPGPEHQSVDSSRPAVEWEQFFAQVDHLVMGRGTYEKVLTFDEWPFAGKQVLVLSTTLRTDDDRVTVCRELDQVTAILDASAGEVYVDGGAVIQSFLRRDLINEITLTWAPVLLGEGLPLFGVLDHDVRLTLMGSHTSAPGLVHATYQVHREHSPSR